MDIDKLEDSLGSVDVDFKKVINQLLISTTYNTALLKVILSNQGKILNQINEDIDVEQFETNCLSATQVLAQEINVEILSRLLK